MNRKRIFLIVISIFVLIIIIGIFNFANRNKVIKTTQEYLQAQENFKENSELDENEEEFVFNCDIVADIQEKTDDVYSVLMNFTSDRCIKKVYDATDSSNKVLLCDWTHNEGKSKSEVLDLHKNKQYKFEIELATGKKIEEDFKLENAEIKLNKARKNQDGTWKFPNATVKNNCGDDIKYIVLQFASGIKSGDKLIVNNVANANVNSTNTMVSINVEGKTSEEIESIIRNNLKVQLADRNEGEEVSIKLSINNGVVEVNLNYYAYTSHFYEFVPASRITWSNAKIAAEQRTYNGMHGYLATITSSGEQDFAASLIQGYGWLGGTCDFNYILDEDGNKIYNNINESLWNWYWVTGPEAGTKFWDNTGTLDVYSNWGSGEPNNSGGEYYLHMYGNNLWNDFANSNGSIAGYVVEYGGMPGDVSTIEETYTDVSTIEFYNYKSIYPELNLTLENWQESDKREEGLFTEANQLLGTAVERSYYKSNDIPAIAIAYYINGAEFMLISPIEDGTIGWCSYDPSHPSSDYASDKIKCGNLKFYYRTVNYIFLGGQPLGQVNCINIGNVSSREEAAEKGLQYYYGE